MSPGVVCAIWADASCSSSTDTVSNLRRCSCDKAAYIKRMLQPHSKNGVNALSWKAMLSAVQLTHAGRAAWTRNAGGIHMASIALSSLCIQDRFANNQGFDLTNVASLMQTPKT